MTYKNGFLLLEVLLGLCLTSLLFFILTYYITIIKNVQQDTLTRLEMLHIARNTIEKAIALREVKNTPFSSLNGYTVSFVDNKYASFVLKQSVIEKNDRAYKKSLSLYAYIVNEDSDNEQ